MPRLYKRPWWPVIDVPDVDPRAVRQKLQITQARLAQMLGVSVRTVEAWERRQWIRRKAGDQDSNGGGGFWKHRYRRPDGAARVLLAMVERDPWVIYDCLSGQLKPRGQQRPRLFD
jgi:DNA-binding transcriptional regulator YiaG